MFRLEAKRVPGWPKLAWTARLQAGTDTVRLLHGPMVEVADDWAAEAVWAGDFPAGDFDRTEHVYGSGVRCRGDKLVFVGSGTGMDFLWWCRRGAVYHVANSLPILLACADLSLRDDYRLYREDIATVESVGMEDYVRSIPVVGGTVSRVGYADLRWDGRALTECAKPETAPPFPDFEAYRAFLVGTARALGANASDPRRTWPAAPLVSISSGYDSPAAAIVAREAGCSQAVTIRGSRSLWRGSDSGKPIADRLGMACREYKLRGSAFRDELAFWAATGRVAGFNFSLFDYPEPLCLFFTATYGDKVWDRLPHDLSVHLGDMDTLLGEFRIRKGMFHTCVPWWGLGRAQEVNRLGGTEEMRPWALGTEYDRPVARRLVEEAGVPRRAFGVRKRNTATNTQFLWPYSPEAQESFRRYLRERGAYAPGKWEVAIMRPFSTACSLLYQNTAKRLGVGKWYRPWRRYEARNLLFQWANHELRDEYLEALEAFDRPSS
jgi:hypothetical protein